MYTHIIASVLNMRPQCLVIKSQKYAQACIVNKNCHVQKLSELHVDDKNEGV